MDKPDPTSERRPETARAFRAVLGFVGICLAVAIVWGAIGASRSRSTDVTRSSSGRERRTAFLGSRACAGCHPGEYALYSLSGHSRTLRRAERTAAARRLNGSTFADPERPGVTWAYALRDGHFSAERRENEKVESFVLEYAFGSGQHATTFVSLTDRTPERPTMFEHRLSVFAHRETPDITPGQGLERGPGRQGDGMTGRHHPTVPTLKCFECHTVATSDRGPRVLDEETMIPNVGCERCHGPGRAHVEAAKSGADDRFLMMPFGLEARSASEELKLCGECHRLPETVIPALISPDHSALVRFQPVGLMQSACFRQSRGKLTCTTCHDPHARTSTDQAVYEAACLACHGDATKRSCEGSPTTGCISCHMPRRDASRGMMMTDHWIRSLPDSARRGDQR